MNKQHARGGGDGAGGQGVAVGSSGHGIMKDAAGQSGSPRKIMSITKNL